MYMSILVSSSAWKAKLPSLIRCCSGKSFAKKFAVNSIKHNFKTKHKKFFDKVFWPKRLVGFKYGFILTSAYIGFKNVSVAVCKQANDEIKDVYVKQSQYSERLDQKFDWKTLFRILRPHVLILAFSIGCLFVVAFMNIKIPILIGELIQCIQSTMNSSPESKLSVSDYLTVIKTPAMKLLMFYVVQGIFTFGYINSLSTLGENIASTLRKSIFMNIIRQDISFFDTHKTHEIMSRLTTDVQEFKSSFKLCVGQGLKALIQASGCIISLYVLSPKLTGFLLVLVPSIVSVGSILGSGLRKLSKNCQAQVAKASAIAGEAIGNLRTVRAFAMENKEDSLYSQEVELVSYFNKKLGFCIGIFQGLSMFALNGIVLSVIGVGGMLVISEDISPGNLMSFLVATQTIQRSLMQMSVLFGQFIRGISAGIRIFEYMNFSAEIPITGGIMIPSDSLQGNLEFKSVSFSYPSRKEQHVLKKISLKIEKGSVVALCGPSGSGKSTVASLIERFYDVDGGCIELDGQNISHVDPSWLRGEVIGYISQEPVLFATSIMENIRYGKPNATDAEVKKAAKLANAENFIEDFPKGYRTMLGERGVTLSGGQKQRIAIARALIKDPTILILDEATSALDAESEKLVQEALDQLVRGRTVLVIAHRLSTIRNADLIAVLCDGVIAESGKHDELVKKKGLYWQLIQQQQYVKEGAGS